jgi:hypothetical protein
VDFEPSFGPFNHGHAGGMEIFFEAGSVYLFKSFETIQIEMKEGQPATRINIDEIERGRVDARGDTQAASQAFHKLSFTGAEFAGEREDRSGLCRAPPGFAERFRFCRAMRNERSHEP